MPNKIKIISVGGSIIIPKTGFDINFLKKFRKLILDEVKKGTKFVLVAGGGATARNYQHALTKITKSSNQDVDWMGIYCARTNAQLLRLLFGKYTFGEVVVDPNKKVKTNKPIICVSGWQAGRSSDYIATTFAKLYGSKEVINLSNIKYVYDKDPKKFKNAKKIEKIDWKSFRKNIVGTKWIPGKNVPFDPVASREAEKSGLKVSILKGTDLKEVKKVLRGEKFRGTVVE